jgi:hypothetical protein
MKNIINNFLLIIVILGLSLEFNSQKLYGMEKSIPPCNFKIYIKPDASDASDDEEQENAQISTIVLPEEASEKLVNIFKTFNSIEDMIKKINDINSHLEKKESEIKFMFQKQINLNFIATKIYELLNNEINTILENAGEETNSVRESCQILFKKVIENIGNEITDLSTNETYTGNMNNYLEICTKKIELFAEKRRLNKFIEKNLKFENDTKELFSQNKILISQIKPKQTDSSNLFLVDQQKEQILEEFERLKAETILEQEKLNNTKHAYKMQQIHNLSLKKEVNQ